MLVPPAVAGGEDMKERGAQRLSNERADSSARWAEVYERFRGVDRSRLAPHELEAFADAAWWLNRLRESIGARQRAYAGYDAAGDARRAAYCAWFLSYDYAIKGDAAVASGWLKRAQRHLAAEPECLEHGLLALAEADGADRKSVV